jgi:NadR type nicotinamide-nucleotide adenylyltransferase
MQVGKNQFEVKQTKTIVVTGPESTGKSTLVYELAQIYGGVAIPEYARQYIMELHRPYNYEDIEIIALKQVDELKMAKINQPTLIIVDTYLIITKVWFEVVYGHYPNWLDEEINKSEIDLFLLCAPDIPWEPDNVRENGGEMRQWLFEEYEKILNQFKFQYKIVRGIGSERIQCAKEHVNKLLLK